MESGKKRYSMRKAMGLVFTAIFGLYQAIFVANAGGAWDNARKLVETELNRKGSDLHAATVAGDTIVYPVRDTSSVAMNPIINFMTLFGLLGVEPAIAPDLLVSHWLAVAFMAVSMAFVLRSFCGMRIPKEENAVV